MRVAFFNSHEVAGGAFPGKWIYLCYGKFWMRNWETHDKSPYGCTENLGKGGEGGRNPPKAVGRKIPQTSHLGAQLVISFAEYLYDTGRVTDTSFPFSSHLLFVCKFSQEWNTNNFLGLGNPGLLYCMVFFTSLMRTPERGIL